MNVFKTAAVLAAALIIISGPGRVSLAMAASSTSLTGQTIAGGSPAALTLTLARAKQIALENSPTLSAAKENLVQAMETIRQARAEYLPTVALTSSWDYDEKTDLSASSQEEAYTNTLSATQVLFQGFYRKYNTLSAQYGQKMSLESLADAKRTLIWSVSQSFLNLQLASENIRIAESDMAFNQDQLKEAEAKERLGTGSYSDVLNYKTKVNTAKAALIEARQSYKEYGFGLAALMGYADARLPDNTRIQALATAEEAAEPEKRDADVDIDTVLDTRTDLVVDDLAVRDADARINRARSDYLPTVSLTGGYGVSGAENLDGLDDSDNMGSSVGVSISFELFSGGAIRSSVRTVMSEKRELEADRKDARITAVSEIRTALESVASARETLTLQAETTRLTGETRDLVKKEYDAGQASLVRMNEAQNDLVAAEGDLADARVSLLLALEELDYYTGANTQ
ncbi:MAG: TolC family protein [Desulfobacterales bacterium]|nr:TolC family protein [Desulfobacterales bacterium]